MSNYCLGVGHGTMLGLPVTLKCDLLQTFVWCLQCASDGHLKRVWMLPGDCESRKTATWGKEQSGSWGNPTSAPRYHSHSVLCSPQGSRGTRAWGVAGLNWLPSSHLTQREEARSWTETRSFSLNSVKEKALWFYSQESLISQIELNTLKCWQLKNHKFVAPGLNPNGANLISNRANQIRKMEKL